MTDIKSLQIRIPKELWAFAKKKGIDREISFNMLIVDLLRKYKEKCEKKLTKDDTVVS